MTVCVTRPPGLPPAASDSVISVISATHVLFKQKKTLRLLRRAFIKSGDFIFSQAVSSQLSSAPKSLTTVFGMGTGVSSSLSSPEVSQIPSGLPYCTLKTEYYNQLSEYCFSSISVFSYFEYLVKPSTY